MLVLKLREVVEAAVLRTSQQVVGDAAKMPRQSIGDFLRDGKDPDYRIALRTAERLALAVGFELVLQPKEPAAPEKGEQS